ncbi:hypothetical protein TNCV_3894731 [Trichonephila clavipes]|nr:hypothetical protein TNCV_3894731 [Trichonephila clavipes]
MTNAKLYIGNLPPTVDEDSLKELLKDKSGRLPISVLVKRGGYAFVECEDPATAERAIASLNAASPLVRLVEGEETWEASDHLQGVLPQNWGETELNRSVTCMVLKATAKQASLSPLPW